ncbi:MAG: hypothetical protein V3V02_05805 [Rhizobiaceae bacterium]
MWQTLVQAIADRQAEVALLPEGVKAWIKFMRILFFGGIIFTPWWKFPRYVILTMILTAATILFGKFFFPHYNTLSVGAVSQLVLWTPLLIYIFFHWRTDFLASVKSGKPFTMFFGVWVAVVSLTLSASHILNIIGVGKIIGS